jgi:hypothetical protein
VYRDWAEFETLQIFFEPTATQTNLVAPEVIVELSFVHVEPALGVAANEGETPKVNASAIEIARNFFILSPKRLY